MKKRSKLWLTVVPLYVFTLLFVLGPMIYMVVLSFQTRAEVWGVVNQFTLDNYKNIFHPVYLQTFAESFKLAITSTLFIVAIGYPFGYFMAKLSPAWKKRMMAFAGRTFGRAGFAAAPPDAAGIEGAAKTTGSDLHLHHS